MVRIHSVVRDTRLRERGETDEKSAKDSKERPQPAREPSFLSSCPASLCSQEANRKLSPAARTKQNQKFRRTLWEYSCLESWGDMLTQPYKKVAITYFNGSEPRNTLPWDLSSQLYYDLKSLICWAAKTFI